MAANCLARASSALPLPPGAALPSAPMVASGGGAAHWEAAAVALAAGTLGAATPPELEAPSTLATRLTVSDGGNAPGTQDPGGRDEEDNDSDSDEDDGDVNHDDSGAGAADDADTDVTSGGDVAGKAGAAAAGATIDAALVGAADTLAAAVAAAVPLALAATGGITVAARAALAGALAAAAGRLPPAPVPLAELLPPAPPCRRVRIRRK